MSSEASPFVLTSRALSPSGAQLDVSRDGVSLGRRAFFEGLRDEASLREALTRALLGHPLPALACPALAWECAPLSRDNAERPMSMHVLPHPALARAEPDPQPFAEHMAAGAGTERVVWFENFGHDARLVVPCAPKPRVRFGHLVDFLTHASLAQRDALWSLVGRLACEHLARTDQPVWVSTAGMAVAWLHVRLDLRPKYYRSESLRSPGA